MKCPDFYCNKRHYSDMEPDWGVKGVVIQFECKWCETKYNLIKVKKDGSNKG